MSLSVLRTRAGGTSEDCGVTDIELEGTSGFPTCCVLIRNEEIEVQREVTPLEYLPR